jgi:hypothetical protein
MSVRRSLQAIPSVLSRPQRAAASIPSPTTVSRTPNTLATVQRRVEIGAAKSAENYLDTSAFSHSGLVEQLVYEGFTTAQAEYGVSRTGL